jgi:hypothetical protein
LPVTKSALGKRRKGDVGSNVLQAVDLDGSH